MTIPSDESRAALDAWFHDVGPDLERKDWRAAFGARYPRLSLENAPVPWTPAPTDLRRALRLLVEATELGVLTDL